MLAERTRQLQTPMPCSCQLQAPPGGYLAAVEGYYKPRKPEPGDDINVTTLFDGPSIAQLAFVWAVPEQDGGPNGSSSEAVSAGPDGLVYVAPKVMPAVPTPQCSEARPVLPAGHLLHQVLECGNGSRGDGSKEVYACPSHLCCGASHGHVGMCGDAPSQCEVGGLCVRRASRSGRKGGTGRRRCCIKDRPATVLLLCLPGTVPEACACPFCLQISSCDASYGFCKDKNDTTMVQFTPHEGLAGLLLGGARPLRWPGPDPDARPGGLSVAPVRQASALYALDSTIADVQFSGAAGTCRCVS